MNKIKEEKAELKSIREEVKKHKAEALYFKKLYKKYNYTGYIKEEAHETLADFFNIIEKIEKALLKREQKLQQLELELESTNPSVTQKFRGKHHGDCPGAPNGISCILYNENEISWKKFENNPVSTHQALDVTKSIFKKHQKEFEGFLSKYYGIRVIETKGKISFEIPTNSPYIRKIEQEGNRYLIEKKEGNQQENYPKITTFKRSEWDEEQLKTMEKRFDTGMNRIRKEIFPNIPSQIIAPVEVAIIEGVKKAAQEYVAFYEALEQKTEVGYRTLLQKHKKTYETIKNSLSAEGELSRISDLAQEYLKRSKEKAKTDSNANPALKEQHKEQASYQPTTITALYTKGAGDQEDLDPNDIQQGESSNCFFLSSVAAIARSNPDAIKKLIEQPDKEGNYTITLYPREDRKSSKRSPKKIKVTPEFATTKDGKILYAGKGDNELWVMLLEKAFAQVMGGFDNIDFGFGGEVMAMLTNKNPRHYHLEDVDKKQFLERLQQASKKNIPVTISSKGQGENREYLDATRFVVTGHLYALEKVVGKNIYLQNPWGKHHLQIDIEELFHHFDDVTILE